MAVIPFYLDVKSIQHHKIQSMKAANERRIVTWTNIFAAISGIVAVIHVVIIWVGFELAREEDEFDPYLNKYELAFWVRLPQAIAFGICALLQLFSAVVILINNAHANTTRSIYYASIIGMVSTFASGAYYCLQASDYNGFTRNYPRTQGTEPWIMLMMWFLQLGAALTLLLALPMFLFIFYHKLDKYIQLQRQEKNEKAENSNLQGWCLGLFLIQALSDIGNIICLGLYTEAEDVKDYNMENALDIYAYYFVVATVVCLAAVGMQIKNNRTRFLTKKQNLLLAVLVGLFQVGVFYTVAITTIQGFVMGWVLGDDFCNFQNDCDAAIRWKWQYFALSIIALVSVVAQIPYLKSVSLSKEPQEQRQTLITTNDEIES